MFIRSQPARSFAAREIVAAMLVVMAVAGCASMGKFSSTGSMDGFHEDGTATLLSDGRVLIAGGFDGTNLVASAELYDPQSGTFSRTGSMTYARSNHTATLLSDGRVLVAGGRTYMHGMGSAELYDPKTGRFSPAGSAFIARSNHTATLLMDERILFVGGLSDDESGVALASAQLYDPKTDKFSPTGSMAVAASPVAAALLSDGRVLVVAGMGADRYGDPLASAELYDPKTGAFSPTGSLARPYWDVTATPLQDGRVLIAGFDPVGRGRGSAELYDPSSGTFSPAGSPSSRAAGGSATLLQDGRVLIAEGDSAELYQPQSRTFSAAASLTESREYFTATLLKDGRVLMAGGCSPSNSQGLWSAELYTP